MIPQRPFEETTLADVGTPADVSEFVTGLLHRLMSRHGGEQIFLFGPSGEPFWPARVPITSSEMRILDQALDFIADKEALLPKPFLAFDPKGRFTAAAVGGKVDLYVVVLGAEADRLVAEVRAVRIRDDLSPELEGMPEGWATTMFSPT